MGRKDALYGYLLTVAGLAVSVFIILIPNKEFLSVYGTSVLVWTAILAAGAADIGFLVYLSWPSHDPLPEALRRVFEKWITVHLWIEELRIKVGIGAIEDPEEFMPVERLQYFEDAKEYLKVKHRKIYGDWTETNRLVDKYNDLAPKKKELLTTVLRSQMKTAYPSLAESPARINFDSPTPSGEWNYYDLPLLIRTFNAHLEDPHRPMERLVSKFEHIQDGRPSTLKSFAQFMISSDDVSDVQIEKLERTFDEVMRNPQFMQTNDELDALETKAKAWLKDFQTKLQAKVDFEEL